MKKILLVLLLLPAFCFAAVTPPKGDFDDRIRTVDYNPKDLVIVTTYYGVSTLVQFSDEEKIIDDKAGDPDAWTITKGDNYLFVQPKERHADTNYTVITSIGSKKRIYHFGLFVLDLPEKQQNDKTWKNSNLVFSLAFQYPDKEVEKKAVVARESSVTAEKEKIKRKLTLRDQNKDGFNFDYWAAGSALITPTSAKDDGRFIYLTFLSNKDIPSISEVDEKGEESLIKKNVQDRTVVIERMVRRLVLRRGDEVVCIVNKSFDPNDQLDAESGTVAPEIERVLNEDDAK